MKEVIILDISFEELEEQYLAKNTSWILERKIGESFSKKELKDFIQDTQEEYSKEYLPYKYALGRKQFREGYDKLDAISKYFIELYSYHFDGGKELEMNKNFLEKLKRYYREHYEVSKSYKKEKFDISSLSITEVVSRYISLPKNLRRNIRCPLHSDKTASFRIYPQTQSFYCFGCHKGGNVVNFVAEIEKISPKEAFKKLANLHTK